MALISSKGGQRDDELLWSSASGTALSYIHLSPSPGGPAWGCGRRFLSPKQGSKNVMATLSYTRTSLKNAACGSLYWVLPLRAREISGIAKRPDGFPMDGDTPGLPWRSPEFMAYAGLNIDARFCRLDPVVHSVLPRRGRRHWRCPMISHVGTWASSVRRLRMQESGNP